MSHRFRFFGSFEGGNQAVLDAEETHHVTRVLRLPLGAEVEVTDGEGRIGRGRLSGFKPLATVDLDALGVEAQPAWPITVALGALKPGDVDEVLPALVELGANHIVLFLQEGSAKHRLTDKALERWQRIVRSAIKQCKTAYTPSLTAVADIAPWLAATASTTNGTKILTDAASPLCLWNALATNPGPLTLVIGGERGLSEEELQQFAQAGFVSAHMGSNILRAVTAAPAALAAASLFRASQAMASPAKSML